MLLLLACSRAPDLAPPTQTRARLYTDHLRWSGQVLRARFELPEGDYAGSELVLEELTWAAEIQLNGVETRVEGGPGWTRVPLVPVAGPNTLEVRLVAGTEVSALARGARKPDARVARNPWFALGGLGELDARLVDGRVESGSKLVATLDGEVLQELPGRWKGPVWTPSSTAVDLVHLWDLRSGVAVRTGLRELGVGAGLRVGGYEGPVVGVRASDDHDAAIRQALSADLNAIEWHGVFHGSDDADHLDELGLALVALPRCDGTIEARPSQIAALSETFARQDANLRRSLRWHPSHVLWSAEGSSQAAEAYVAGLDGALVGTRDLALGTIPPRETPGSAWWSIETLAHQVGGYPAEIEAVEAQLGQQMVGGVVLTPPGGPAGAGWAEAWSAVDAVSAPADGRRAHARVTETIPAGQVLWVEGDWLPRVGQVSAGGPTTVEVWYQGEVLVNGAPREVSAGTWQAGVWTP